MSRISKLLLSLCEEMGGCSGVLWVMGFRREGRREVSGERWKWIIETWRVPGGSLRFFHMVPEFDRVLND